ncbi:biotin--[acetyl-CoA-carboxylase] ligase [Brevundimonas sp. 2R-24]|uniref:biotin--[biotin carboxyl-carrier protein] ligase n=1 Tax=Peiella sedimenti TaxID=3061083 RepID=A0ABT8SN61_9CAUL|nr:biotin--[acetyl-CoA-carboxylase] ligase [Caulobacteraceae bacterium XZ-24]
MPAPPILWLDVTDSTNAEARKAAEAGQTDPLWFAARRQTAGRGRRGRSWSTGEGDLAATLLTFVDLSPPNAARVTFVAALAVADLLDGWAAPGLVSIKWPNDVLLDGAKCSGVLVESGPAAGGGLWLGVGIGVNLSSTPPEPLLYRAASLAQHLGPHATAAPTQDEAMAFLAEALDRWLQVWLREGPEPILAAWSARATGLHGPCVARLGSETLEGTAEGVAPDGALRLRLPDGTLRLVSAGDVFPGGG